MKAIRSVMTAGLAAWALTQPCSASAATKPQPGKLAFTPAETNEFHFDTGELRGVLRAGGKSRGLSSVVHVPSGARLDGGSGLFGLYRLFANGQRFGTAGWDLPSTAELQSDGSVQAVWPATAERPFELRANYRWATANALDLETTVIARTNLTGLEVFLASYFQPQFTNSRVYAQLADAKPGFVSADRTRGDWQMFPRDDAAWTFSEDGRWQLQPNPLKWARQQNLARPLALRQSPANGLTALITASAADCFAVCTPFETESHYSTYLSLFGHDLKAGETARARARLIIAAGLSDTEAVRLGEEFASASPVVTPGAKLEKLAGDFKFTEGPSCDREGNVFFTDQPNNRIMKWSVDGKLSTFMQPAGRANGMCFDAQGNLIACADEKTELWAITPDGQHTVLAKEYAGKKLNAPNDVWVRADGSLFFTDPFYKRDWWDYDQPPQGTEQVYFLSADRKTLKRVTTDLSQPNGIIGTPDGRTLFVADIRAGKTYAYDIQADGSLANKRLRCELGSDGMTLDTEGNLYLTGKGVTVFDPTGRKITNIPVPENWTANVSFGGKDHKTLFITASRGLYSIRMNYAGANAAK